MRIVLDTNVLVSALLSPAGPPDELLSHWERGDVMVVTSAEQCGELERVLAYPKLQSRIDPSHARYLTDKLEQVAEVVTALPSIDACEDPDDNIILATAIAGRAEFLVTGDRKHLLPLREIQDVKIVTVQEILAQLPPRPQSDIIHHPS